MRYRYIITALCIAILVQLVSAGTADPYGHTGDGWFDTFNSSSSSYYSGDVADFTWNTGLGYLNATTSNKQLYRNETNGAGTYTWIYTVGSGETGGYTYCVFGSQWSNYTGTPVSTGSKYYFRVYYGSPTRIYIYVVIGGTATSLQLKDYTLAPGTETNVTVVWNASNETSIVVFYNGSAELTSTNKSYSTGYAGIGLSTAPTITSFKDFWFNYSPSAGGSPPTADFTANITTVIDDDNCVEFTDSSTVVSATSWDWDIDGDGDSDYTTRNATHTYTTAGTYTVCHSVTNSSGTDWENKTNYITVTAKAPPTAAFAANITTVIDDDNCVMFNETSTVTSVVSYQWDIDGDGDVEYTTRNATNTYTTAGTYSVHFSITNASGTDWENKTNYITVTAKAPPTAAFSGNVTSGIVSFAVLFTDSSTATGTIAYAWDIDGDGDVDYAVRNATHTYTVAGTYTVCFKVTNESGSDWENKTAYITATTAAVPTAEFSADDTTVTLADDVTFTDSSTVTSATGWNWDIDGDGDSDYTTRNTTHTYTVTGTYTVCHSVTNASGTDWENKTNYITVTNETPIAGFSANDTTIFENDAVAFTGSTIVNGDPDIDPLTWDWDVDGDDSFEYSTENCVHVYTTAGIYTVRLRTVNDGGTDWENKTNYITVTVSTNVAADFTYVIVGGTTVQFTDMSTGAPSSWSWDFGDGTSSTEQNPIHAYFVKTTLQGKNFTVDLNVSDVATVDNESKLCWVNRSPLAAPIITTTLNQNAFSNGTTSYGGWWSNQTSFPYANFTAAMESPYQTFFGGWHILGVLGIVFGTVYARTRKPLTTAIVIIVVSMAAAPWYPLQALAAVGFAIAFLITMGIVEVIGK